MGKFRVVALSAVLVMIVAVSGGAAYASDRVDDTLAVRRIGASFDNNNGSPKSTSIPKRWKWGQGHYAGVGIFYSGLVQNLGNLSLGSDASFMRQTPKSFGVNINLVDFTILSNRHFGLITGLGFEINNFRFDQNMTLAQSADGQIAPRYFTDIELSKSKLTTTYLNIPLLAEFQFGRAKKGTGKMRGFVNFGVTAGIRLDGHTKYKSAATGIQKQHGGLNLRNFHYGFEVNAGYSHYGIFARYYPQSIFINDGGPQVQQVNIGIMLTL